MGEFSNQQIKVMFEEMWGNNQEIFDFLPSDDNENGKLQSIIGIVIDDLYKKECKFIESLAPSRFQV